MEPVQIVGAGPVGLVTGLLLARLGVPSVVSEAAVARDEIGSKAICFQRDVLDILHRVGCAEAMLAEGTTWTTGRTYYRDHELFSVEFPAPDGTPPWINISQARVERLLADAADAEPLIDLRYGRPVTGVGDGFTVGADGPRSVVRRSLGIGFPGRSYGDLFLICDIRADLPFPNERRFYFAPEWNPGRQVLVHQCPHSTWRIDWQVPAGFDLAGEYASGALDTRIRKIVGARPYEIVWMSVYRFHERVAERFQAGRAFLAGDAAHLYAPFGARGLNSGIQDAENLAWKLAYVLHGRAPEALLSTYEQERRPAALENLRVTERTMRFLVPRTDAERARREEILERAITDPAARARIDSGRLAEPFRYADSPLTTGHAGMLCPDDPPGLRRRFGRDFVTLDRADGVYVIRPDGHVAAILPDHAGVAEAVRRATMT